MTAYVCGAIMGAAAALMFIAPIETKSGLETVAIGACVGVVTATLAIVFGWLMLVWRDPAGSKKPRRRVMLASFGAGVGVFVTSIIVGIVLMPKQYLLYLMFGVLSGVVTFLIAALVISQAERRAQLSVLRSHPPVSHRKRGHGNPSSA